MKNISVNLLVIIKLFQFILISILDNIVIICKKLYAYMNVATDNFQIVPPQCFVWPDKIHLKKIVLWNLLWTFLIVSSLFNIRNKLGSYQFLSGGNSGNTRLSSSPSQPSVHLLCSKAMLLLLSLLLCWTFY